MSGVPDLFGELRKNHTESQFEKVLEGIRSDSTNANILNDLFTTNAYLMFKLNKAISDFDKATSYFNRIMTLLTVAIFILTFVQVFQLMR